MPADLTIRNARVIDGTGMPAFDADVAVEGGRIVAVGEAPAGTREVDGTNLTLAPGFVDTHTHDDGALLAHPGLEFKVSQGCTTLVVGNCGFSPFPGTTGSGGLFGRMSTDLADLDAFREAAHAAGIAANAIALIGHNAMRTAAVGPTEKRPAGIFEIATMRDWVEEAMAQGACGFSTGLIYTPGRWASTEEVIEVAGAAGAAGGLYATHMRNEGNKLLEAVDEAIRISEESGCLLHISHHKAAGKANWGRVVDSLAKVDEANERGADITLDVYPYTAGSGRMIEYFNIDDPDPGLAEVIRLASCPAFPEYEGRMLVDIAAETEEALPALVRRILTAEKGERTICIHFTLDEADIETNLRHPLMMVGSDGIPDLSGQPHPRLFGTMPRVLGEYVRERQVLTLEEAIRRMTSLSCDRFGLTGRGRIAEGMWADLVLFDSSTIRDKATYDDPKQASDGVVLVTVNGEVAFDHGTHTGAGAGRLLRYQEENLP
ncbi:MAG: N-acyl-D-amino-acid deacylase family protein [Acidimicrobiales bacterium]